MSISPGDDERFYCPFCEPEKVDLTDLVLAERDQSIIVLRGRQRGPRKWSVMVKCPNDHDVAVDGEFT
jgi:hypothetical protein